MKPIIYRAQRFGSWERSREKWALERRFYRRVCRRVAKCLGVEVRYIKYDWHDNSIEVYGCDQGRRLTRAESARIFGMGVGVCWLNSDRQEVTYRWNEPLSGHVSATTSDAWRKSYPDAIVIWKGERMTLAECDARREAEKAVS